jgi:hypothetical protein
MDVLNGEMYTMCYIKLFPRTFGAMAKVQCDNIQIQNTLRIIIKILISCRL